MNRLFVFGYVTTIMLVWICYSFAGEPKDPGNWSHWRGSGYDEVVNSGTDIFSRAFSFKTNWHRPLGSGYSSISVYDGYAITMYSDSTFDYTIAFDAETGQEMGNCRCGTIPSKDERGRRHNELRRKRRCLSF